MRHDVASCLFRIDGTMAEERVERRLTAILAADVAGYSRLMGATTKDTELDAAR
jgi:class 3 adenylate cyclase